MNKTMKTFGTLLACLALAGTCLAAPRGGFGGPGRYHAPAPIHHHGGSHWHNPPPPPPHHVHHHGHHHAGLFTLGAAAIGGLIGGLFGW